MILWWCHWNPSKMPDLPKDQLGDVCKAWHDREVPAMGYTRIHLHVSNVRACLAASAWCASTRGATSSWGAQVADSPVSSTVAGWRIPTINGGLVCWEHHRTKWWIFQQAMFDYRRVYIYISHNIYMYGFAMICHSIYAQFMNLIGTVFV